MNYDLAQQLKDAGFPVQNSGWDEGFEEKLKLPTLSELIAACGERFCLFLKGTTWIAGISTEEPSWYPEASEEGDTPEEAVARLWLALNKHERAN